MQRANAAKTMKSKARMVLDITEESGDKFGLWDFFALNNVLTSSVVTSFVTEKRKEEGFLDQSRNSSPPFSNAENNAFANIPQNFEQTRW